MDNSLYLAMQGANQTLIAQSINANNLANVKTTGFKADLYNANSVAMLGEGVPSQVYVVDEVPTIDLAPGVIVPTGRDLDVAIDGQGLLAVQTKEGVERYTRSGHFQMTADGLLTTPSGELVLGSGGPITLPPAQKIDIGQDGTISVVPLGATDNTLVSVDKLKLVKANGQVLQKDGSGLISTADQSLLAEDLTVKVVSRSLEGSNVNAVDSMVNMISLARQYEIQMKMIQSIKENDEQTAQLLQIS